MKPPFDWCSGITLEQDLLVESKWNGTSDFGWFLCSMFLFCLNYHSFVFVISISIFSSFQSQNVLAKRSKHLLRVAFPMGAEQNVFVFKWNNTIYLKKKWHKYFAVISFAFNRLVSNMLFEYLFLEHLISTTGHSVVANVILNYTLYIVYWSIGIIENYVWWKKVCFPFMQSWSVKRLSINYSFIFFASVEICKQKMWNTRTQIITIFVVKKTCSMKSNILNS